MTTDEVLRKLVFSLLDDDSGISQNTWDELTDYLQCQGEFELLGEVTRIVKIAEGGGTVPEGRRFIDRGPEWQTIESWADFKACKTN